MRCTCNVFFTFSNICAQYGIACISVNAYNIMANYCMHAILYIYIYIYIYIYNLTYINNNTYKHIHKHNM